MTYWPRNTDTAEITALGDRIRALEIARRALMDLIRDHEIQIDDQRLAQKPDFPTDRQRELLGYAASHIKSGTEARSHLGDPALDGDYTVKVAGRRGWLSIQDLAPSSVRNGHKLWSFEPEDIEAFAAILADEGLMMVDHWLHQDGVSIITRPVKQITGTPACCAASGVGVCDDH